MSQQLLSADRVTFAFVNQSILKEVSLSVDQGEIVALVGRNGAGKTTLLRTLLGLHKPQSGRVFLQGKTLEEFPPADVAEKVGALFSDQLPDSAWTAAEILELGAIGRKVDPSRVNFWTEKLQLQPLLNKKLHTLSSGERQRIMIARSVLQASHLWVMDEPLSHLDLGLGAWLMECLCLEAKAQDCAFVFSSHDLAPVMQWADKVCVLDKGEITSYARTDEHLLVALDKALGQPNYRLQADTWRFTKA